MRVPAPFLLGTAAGYLILSYPILSSISKNNQKKTGPKTTTIATPHPLRAYELLIRIRFPYFQKIQGLPELTA